MIYMLKKVIIGILICLVVVIGGGRLFIHLMSKNLVKDVAITNIELSNFEDGEYLGEFYKEPVNAEVKVIVENKKIADIVILKHEHGLGGKGEQIIDKVLESQSLDVDVISGATASSKVILKAIENALIGN